MQVLGCFYDLFILINTSCGNLYTLPLKYGTICSKIVAFIMRQDKKCLYLRVWKFCTAPRVILWIHHKCFKHKMRQALTLTAQLFGTWCRLLALPSGIEPLISP